MFICKSIFINLNENILVNYSYDFIISIHYIFYKSNFILFLIFLLVINLINLSNV